MPEYETWRETMLIREVPPLEQGETETHLLAGIEVERSVRSSAVEELLALPGALADPTVMAPRLAELLRESRTGGDADPESIADL